jgi:hypothetical protein
MGEQNNGTARETDKENRESVWIDRQIDRQTDREVNRRTGKYTSRQERR